PSAGNSLPNGRDQIDTDRILEELHRAESGPHTTRSEPTIAAIRSQLAAAERLDHTIADTYDRLRLLDARIDETVTRTIELSVTQTDTDDLGGIGAEVESIVGDMEALRQAVEETRRSTPGTGLPSTGTGTCARAPSRGAASSRRPPRRSSEPRCHASPVWSGSPRSPPRSA